MWGLDSAEAAVGAAGSSTQSYPSFDHRWSDLIRLLVSKMIKKECNYTKPQSLSITHSDGVGIFFIDGCLEGTDRWEVERLGSEYLLLPSYHGWKWWSWQSDNPYHAQPGFFCCVFRDLGCKEIQSPLSRLWFQIFFMFTHVHPYLGKWSHLTNILETGWNQLVVQSLLMHQRSSRQSSASCGFLSRDICSPFIDHYPRSLSLNQTAYFKGFLRTRTFYA